MRYAKLGLVGLVACLLPLSAEAQIKLPYFRTLSNDDVCGGYSNKCQPKSGEKDKGFTGEDYREIRDWLGAYSKNGIRDPRPCEQQYADNEIYTTGGHKFSGKSEKKYKGSLRSRFAANVTQYLSGLMVVLPPGLQSKLNADATDSLATNSISSVEFEYNRHYLANASIAKLMKSCTSAKKGNKFIIGVSTVTISGDWARSRIIDSVGEFEKTTEFLGLDDATKAKYADRREAVLAGTFQPMSLVIGTTWRTFEQ